MYQTGHIERNEAFALDSWLRRHATCSPRHGPAFCNSSHSTGVNIRSPQLRELLLQSLEHERGGVILYQTALECVLNDDLRDEWEKYLEQTENHVELLTTACETLGLDPDE
jgi:hypothetical protein